MRSVYDGIVMHYAVPTPFKHVQILTGFCQSPGKVIFAVLEL